MHNGWRKSLPCSPLALYFNQAGHTENLNYLPQNATGARLNQRLVLIKDQSRVWLLRDLGGTATCEPLVPWHQRTQQVRMDRWTLSQVPIEGGRQASEICVKVHWERNVDFWPPTPPPEVSVAYTSHSIHTLVSLQNEHIVLCRGGQFPEFHFTPSICLMNNNEFEGFTGFQHWAEICINRFSDLAWFWFCLDRLPLACPCMGNFYAAKLNQPLHFPLKSRNK